ncbi:hypothetical protein PCASD_04214 [Puccinia coronata f. sp. avenae]|uniref:Uncharacterized protein n=1 Tax=Puccinia coronata f. sp. avenae TaxID=200324 RepID=A0A2N5V7Y1_9BASI|nr:hypothetical protein PCASD_04214 [Puccinia coronata f. sp. avenae]
MLVPMSPISPYTHSGRGYSARCAHKTPGKLLTGHQTSDKILYYLLLARKDSDSEYTVKNQCKKPASTADRLAVLLQAQIGVQRKKRVQKDDNENAQKSSRVGSSTRSILIISSTTPSSRATKPSFGIFSLS